MRILTLALCVVLASVAAPSAFASRGASLCKGPRDAQGAYFVRCFPPSQRARAETLLTFRPVNADRVVVRMSHLRLSQIAVTLPVAGRPPAGGSASEISYVFGTIPRGPRGVPLIIGPGLGQYLIVEELAGHNPTLARFAIVRQEDEGTYWLAHAAFRCHAADLLVTSDEPRREVTQITREALQSEVCSG